MARLPRVTGRQTVAALVRAGWIVRRQSGSHVRLSRPDGSYKASVPVHVGKTLRLGTLQEILRQVGWTDEELQRWL